MTERLSASVEASALIRRAQADGDFAMVLQKGDPDRGALLLVIRSRQAHVTCLERVLSMDGGYRWERVGPGESAFGQAEVAEFVKKRTAFDSDSWIIELDIAHPERFIAETTGSA